MSGSEIRKFMNVLNESFDALIVETVDPQHLKTEDAKAFAEQFGPVITKSWSHGPNETGFAMNVNKFMREDFMDFLKSQNYSVDSRPVNSGTWLYYGGTKSAAYATVSAHVQVESKTGAAKFVQFSIARDRS